LVEFAVLVKRMRDAQHDHRRGVGELINVQRLEREVDIALKAILEGGERGDSFDAEPKAAAPQTAAQDDDGN
jgi:hypothetical protein